MKLHLMLALLAVICTSFAEDSTQVIGHVIQPSGVWYDKRYAYRVGKGYEIFSDSALVRRSQDADDYVRIRFYADGHEHRFDCQKINCSEPLDLLSQVPKSVDNSSPVVAFLRAVYGVVEENLPHNAGQARSLSGYARTFSPRGNADVLSDNLVLLSSEGIDLTPVVEKLPRGDYLLELCPIGQDTKALCEDPPVAFAFSWVPGRNTSWKPPRDFKLGLYQLNLCQKIGDRTLRSGDSAWVLLVDPTQHDKARKEYDDAVALTRSWSRSESEMLLRAYIQHMNLALNH
jgi:hypothetical protein